MTIISSAAILGLAPASAVPNASPRAIERERARSASQLRPDDRDSGVLVVSVSPGPLAISTSENVLTLTRVPGKGRTTRYRGILPRVRVIDLRGSLIGWNATVTFFTPSSMSATDLSLRARPGRPVVVSGRPRGIHAAGPVWTTLETPVSLFSAEPGFGAGTYDEDALVELVLPFGSDVKSIKLEYETSVS